MPFALKRPRDFFCLETNRRARGSRIRCYLHRGVVGAGVVPKVGQLRIPVRKHVTHAREEGNIESALATGYGTQYARPFLGKGGSRRGLQRLLYPVHSVYRVKAGEHRERLVPLRAVDGHERTRMYIAPKSVFWIVSHPYAISTDLNSWRVLRHDSERA